MCETIIKGLRHNVEKVSQEIGKHIESIEEEEREKESNQNCQFNLQGKCRFEKALQAETFRGNGRKTDIEKKEQGH